MAYNTQDLLAKALKIIPEKNLFFFEDVYTFLGISKSTFYEHFPNQSNDYKQIAELLNQNAVTTKHSMRKKWYKSDNATLQVSLMKMIGNDEDRKRLTQTYSKNELSGAIGTVDLSKDPDALTTLLTTFEAIKEKGEE